MFLSATLLSCIVFAGAMRPLVQEDGWKKQLDKDGITVHTRTVAGSKLKSFRSEMTIEGADPASVRSVLVDVKGFPKWTSDVKSVEVLKAEDREHQIYRVLIRVPFPFERRDLVQEMEVVDLSGKAFRVELTNRPAFVEPDKRSVRMPAADGYWEVSSPEDGRVRIVFEYHSDPGGDIPPWLVNMFIVQSPFKTLRNLRELVTG